MAKVNLSRKHSKGPWAAKTGSFGVGRYIEAADGHPVCQLSANTTPKGLAKERSGEAAANARLLAAAPDLLAALDKWQSWYAAMQQSGRLVKVPSNSHVASAGLATKAALAKVEG